MRCTDLLRTIHACSALQLNASTNMGEPEKKLDTYAVHVLLYPLAYSYQH